MPNISSHLRQASLVRWFVCKRRSLTSEILLTAHSRCKWMRRQVYKFRNVCDFEMKNKKKINEFHFLILMFIRWNQIWFVIRSMFGRVSRKRIDGTALPRNSANLIINKTAVRRLYSEEKQLWGNVLSMSSPLLLSLTHSNNINSIW